MTGASTVLNIIIKVLYFVASHAEFIGVIRFKKARVGKQPVVLLIRYDSVVT